MIQNTNINDKLLNTVIGGVLGADECTLLRETARYSLVMRNVIGYEFPSVTKNIGGDLGIVILNTDLNLDGALPSHGLNLALLGVTGISLVFDPSQNAALLLIGAPGSDNGFMMDEESLQEWSGSVDYKPHVLKKPRSAII